MPYLEEFVQTNVVEMFPLLPWQGMKHIAYTCGSELHLYRIGA